MPRRRLQDHYSRNLLLLAAFIVAMVLLVAITTTYIQASKLSEHRKEVIRTQHLITLLTRLESAIYKVEAQQRGYMITGRRRYLEPFKDSKESLYTLYHSIEKLSGDGHLKKEHLEEMKSHIDIKLKELEDTIELRQKGHYQEARKVVLTDIGQKEMDAFVEIMRIIKREENRTLRIQSRQLEKAATEALDSLITRSGLSILAFLLGFVYIQRVDAKRRKNRLTQQLLFDVSSTMAKSEDLSTSITGILEAISEQFNWQVGIFWSENRQDQILECKGFFSQKDLPELEQLIRSSRKQKGEGLAGKVWSEDTASWLKDISGDKSSPLVNEVQKAGLHSAFAFPIYSGERVNGIFEFISNRIEKPDKELIEAFSIVGAEIGQLVERRAIEDKLQKSLNELAKANDVMDSVFDNMSSGVIYSDSSGDVTIFNKSVERILGPGSKNKKIADWEGKIFHADEDKPVHYEELPLVKALKGESTHDFTMKVITDESINGIILNVNGRPVRDDKGDIVGGVIVVDDITARHEAEKRVSEFYSMVSHELRTPLTSIKGSLGLLEGGKGGELSPKAKRLVSMGREECDRLVRLINDILDIRKIEAGKLEIKKKQVIPQKVILEVIESLSPYAGEHKVKLIAGDACTEPIMADRDRIAQILTNLISNAVKFSPEGGEVKVTAELKPEKVLFKITDQGPGINKLDQQKLFKIFQQLNSTDSRPKGGTGLGLAICKALVEEHDGEIGLDSEPGKGSTFWFEISRFFPEGNNGGETLKEPAENEKKKEEIKSEQ